MPERSVDGRAVGLHAAQWITYAPTAACDPREQMLGPALAPISYSDNNVRAPLQLRLKLREKRWVVLPVCIHRYDELTPERNSTIEPGVESPVVTAIARMNDHFCTCLRGDSPRTVCRSVIDNDHQSMRQCLPNDRSHRR